MKMTFTHIRHAETLGELTAEIREPTRRTDSNLSELIALFDTTAVRTGDVLRVPGTPLGFELMPGRRTERGRVRVPLATRIIDDA